MTNLHLNASKDFTAPNSAGQSPSPVHLGFLRLRHIIGDSKKGLQPLVPVSRSTWYAGVASGRFPKPIRLSEGVAVWRASDIHALCLEIERQEFGGLK